MYYWCNLFWPDLPNVILQRSSGLNRWCNSLAALKLTITILPVHLKMYLMVFFVFSSKKCFSVNGETSPKISYFVKKISHVRRFLYLKDTLMVRTVKAFECQICTFLRAWIRTAGLKCCWNPTWHSTHDCLTVFEGKKQLKFQNTHILEENFPNER